MVLLEVVVLLEILGRVGREVTGHVGFDLLLVAMGFMWGTVGDSGAIKSPGAGEKVTGVWARVRAQSLLPGRTKTTTLVLVLVLVLAGWGKHETGRWY